MADVQPDNRFTMIANQVLEAIQHFQFTQNQFKILLLLWRNTYGWHRDECELSLSFIEQNTHLDRKRASATLQDLIKANVILEINKGSSTKSKVVSFNKNYMEWTIKQYKSSGILTTSGQEATSGKLTTSSSGEVTTSGSGHSATHKRNILNKDLNKDIAAVDNAHEESTGGVPTTESVQLPEKWSVGQIPGSSSSDYERIRDYYMQLSGARGFDVNAMDQQAIMELLSYKIDINKVLVWLKECFENYQPKHNHDKINSFRYCLPQILDKHFSEKEVKVNGSKVRQYSGGYGGSRKQSKTAEDAYREIEQARRAWGG